MHHFIYSDKDTYLTNQTYLPNKNFGLDEILRVGTSTVTTKVTSPTKTQTYNGGLVQNTYLYRFTGSVSSASFCGTVDYASGSIIGSAITTSFQAEYFSGSLSGTFVGWMMPGAISVNSSSETYSGSLINFSGSVSSSNYINGFVSGNLITYYSASSDTNTVFSMFSTYNGILSGSTGTMLYGYLTGDDVTNVQNIQLQTKKFMERSLLYFDLAEISKSIVDGSITAPQFTLRLRVSREENLPVTFSLYAFPVSQSWEMGDGYLSDGNGSLKGASWNFKNYYSGSSWYPYTDTLALSPINFVSNPDSATESFARGGGTWHTSSAYICSQSFDYESSDISMSVNRIVLPWLSGTIPNEGFILVTSDEFTYTGSQMSLLYFSHDSNTIYQPYLDTAWNDSSWVTGSITTSSVVISIRPAGVSGSLISGSSITGSSVSGSFTGQGEIHYDTNTSASGFVYLQGSGGTINGVTILGDITGSKISSTLMATLINGDFSASVITASIDALNYLLTAGTITGSWSGAHLMSSSISQSIGTGFNSRVFVDISGSYITGKALGVYTSNVNLPTGSGTFNGVFVNGVYAGASVFATFSGSALTSSYSYTSSVEYENNSLDPLQTNKPFAVVVQNIPSKISGDNIVRINVFGREEFPLKNFTRATQLTQYLTPKYLPLTSFYAIKDNETEYMILPFDAYTNLSCDVNGNYFLLDATGIPQERYYRLLIKVEQSGSTYTFDNNNVFKIIR